MIYLVAFFCALLAGAATGFGVGLGAAELFTRLGGSREGANAMGGFFFIGPFGLLAGFLATFGLIVRYGGGSNGIAKWSLIGSACVAGLGTLFVLLAVSDFAPRGNGQVADFNLKYEIELPVGVDPAQAKHGYQGEGSERFPDWPFWDVQKQDSGSHIVGGGMQMTDYPAHRFVLLTLDGKEMQKFEVPFAGRVDRAVDWSEWKEGAHGARFRWRMHKAR